MRPIRLYINIDHVATVRQARRTDEPDPVAAARLCESAGADGITVHLREDRRHIQDREDGPAGGAATNRINANAVMTKVAALMLTPKWRAYCGRTGETTP